MLHICFEEDYGISKAADIKSALDSVKFKPATDVLNSTPRRRIYSQYFDYDIAKRCNCSLQDWQLLPAVDRAIIIEEIKSADKRIEEAKTRMQEGGH